MNILILNWRDFKNPKAGGAEVLTHELAKRWVRVGHNVTLFTSLFRGSLPEENIDGVAIIRRGKWWSVYIKAFYYYLFVLKGNVDIVVDEVHWFPFFSVLYAQKKTVLLVCEVAKTLFFRLFPFPFATLGRLLEKLYMFLYRKVPVLAISQSTKEALVAEGILPGSISVIPMGLTLPKRSKRFIKDSRFTLIVVGRLHVLKGIADAIEAFVRIQTQVPTASLWIVGSDSEGYQRELKRRADALGIGKKVKFFGRVSEEKKFELLARAHILLMPSVHEGWGLVVAEAASQGTPAVGYRTSGVQDVIMHDKTGVLVAPGDSDALARETLRLWDDRPRYFRYQKAGRKRAISMHWEDTARVSLAVLQRMYEKK